MTTFLQTAIDAGIRIDAVPIRGGWIEIDSHDDLAAEPLPETDV